MKNKTYILGTLVLVLFVTTLGGQSEYKDELRAPWVATVANIDWPLSRYDNAEKQKADLIAMLDLYKSMHMNAIFLQVRPECDALYASNLEPWSRYVSGTQGENPGYDPLAFALEEAHKRGIEVHAWMNPYRLNASANPSDSYFHSSHIYKEHPEWAIKYPDGKYILNPGRPEVMAYIGEVVRDMLENYAVDGVHFDDYFYAYGGTSNSLDQSEYDTYGNGMSRGDWRRDNVNRMIDTVHRAVQETRPTARFGVSPFGIWRPGNPEGIYGMDAYSTIYCDPMAWLEDKTVDYLTPQLYWPTGGGQDFESLANWWSDSVQSAGRHFYPGHGTYRMDQDPSEKKSTKGSNIHESKWYMDLNLSHMEQSLQKGTGDPVAEWTLGQIGLQIDIVRLNHEKGALGSVFFSAKDFTRVAGLAAYIKEHKYTHAALTPEMSWKADDTPAAPTNLRWENSGGEYMLKWDAVVADNQRFAIYAEKLQTNGNELIADPANLQLISFVQEVSLAGLALYPDSYLSITAVSATGRESSPHVPIQIPDDLPLTNLLSPDQGATVGTDAVLSWSSTASSPLYNFQLARTSTFSHILFETNWTSQDEIIVEELGLEGESAYFWRARSKDELTGVFADFQSFTTGYPAVPELLSPAYLEQDVSRIPTIEWNASDAADEIVVQISLSSSFDPILLEENMPASGGSGKLSTELDADRWYYIRIAGKNTYGTGQYSDLATFKTGNSGSVILVQLESPVDLSTAASFDQLQWTSSGSTGSVTYMVEIAVDDAFSGGVYNSGWISAQNLLIEDLNLEGKRSYYWRVKAKDDKGEGDYSEVWSFTAAYPSRPKISLPVHLSSGVSARPTIAWTTGTDSENIYAEFSEESDFSSIRLTETMVAAPGSGTITGSLLGYTWYYLRIKAINSYGRSVFSALRYFETGEGTSIELPADDADRLLVYPSPLSEGVLSISYHSQSANNIRLMIMDQTGRKLWYQEIDSPREGEKVAWKIPSGDLPGSGIYIVRMMQDSRSESSLFVVN